MTVASASWQELLEPGLRTIFNKQMKQKKDYLPLLFNVQGSKKAIEHNQGTGNVGLMEDWNNTGNQVAYEDVNKGFGANYRHKKYSKGIQIERELHDDDQYGEIAKRVKGLAQASWYTRQIHGASIFNNAFSSAYVGPDGVALCSAAHPLAPGSGTTFSNFAAYTLTDDNLELVRNAMKAWTDDKGNLLAVNPDTLIVPSTLRKQALVITDSDNKADTQLNNVNVYKGTMKVIEYDFLTDSNAWYVADSSRMDQFLNWYDRRRPVPEMETVFDSELLKYKLVGRWSFGWDDPTFLFGCNT